MKRVTFITGHYGSGKSEFSINYAIQKKIQNIVDLDIVNPYFRSRELSDVLEQNGIKLHSSPLKDSLGSDLPYIAKEAYTLIKSSESVIYDLGGDPIGAKVVRQFVDSLDLSEVEFLFVINTYRQETNSLDKILKMIREIESASGLRVSGFINNSNLIRDTDCMTVKESEKIIKDVIFETKLDIKYTSIIEGIAIECSDLLGEVIPLKLYLRKKWL